MGWFYWSSVVVELGVVVGGGEESGLVDVC